MVSWDLEAVTAAFSDAAIDPSRWSNALNIVSKQTHSFGAFIVPVTGGRIPGLPISERMDQALDAYFRGGWYLRDHRMRGLGIMQRAGVFDDLDISTVEEIKRNAYYEEFLAPVGLRWFAGVNVACGHDIWCLSIQRSRNQMPFSPEEKRRLAALSTHLSSVAATAKALGFSAANAAMETFEISDTAVVLLNRTGEVIRANRSAEGLLNGDPRIFGKRLVSGNPDATAALDRALHRLLWNHNAAFLAPPIPLPRTGRRPVLAYPLKLSSVSLSALVDCQAIVVLVDLDKHWRPPEMALQISFGLTAAEAKLASKIASGTSLDDLADELGIAKETSRNQLKSIFQKIGVHRQAELVAVLARLIGRK